MKQMLLTGFAPFGGETVNPAWEAVKLLPDTLGGFRIEKLQVPVVFGEAGETVLAAAARLKPDVILCVGQAGGRAAVTPEKIGVNLRNARIPDNGGNRPENTPVIPGGPDGLFSTLPVERMTARAKQAGCRCAVSYSAGVYVCNDLLYTLLYRLRGTDTRAGFVHVPYLPEQAKNGEPSMELSETAAALSALISALDEGPEETK